MATSSFHAAAKVGHKFPLAEVAHAADIDLPVLQQWIIRNLVHIEDEGSGPGVERKARAVELRRTVLMAHLLENRMPVQDAARAAWRVTSRHWEGGPWFFAVRSGLEDINEGTSRKGQWLVSEDHIAEVLTRDGLIELLDRPDMRRLIVIPLHVLDQTISDRLQEYYEHFARRPKSR